MGLARVAFRSPASFLASSVRLNLARSAWRSCLWLALTLLAWGAAGAQVTLLPAWQQQSPATSPSARDGAAMAYDAAHGQVVMFGGDDSSGNPLKETWTYDGVTWTHQFPATSPSARRDASMTYDAAHNQVVLFGGTDGTSLSPTHGPGTGRPGLSSPSSRALR